MKKGAANQCHPSFQSSIVNRLGLDLPRAVVLPCMLSSGRDTVEDTSTLAVFIDFENLALGFQGKKKTRFEIRRGVGRVVEKRKIVFIEGYGVWVGSPGTYWLLYE